MKQIVDIRCVDSTKPLNIVDEIYFTWRLVNCEKQKSFLIKIFDENKEILSVFKQSEKQYLYINRLQQLKPLTRYSYNITVTTDTFCEQSDTCCFCTGLIDGFDKKAKWISFGDRFVAESEQVGSKALYFKKTIDLQVLPQFAIANICGLGLYEFCINGKKVGNRVLEPAFTDYLKTALYSTYDVKEYLKKGENILEITLGDGWYNQTTKDTWGFYRAAWRDSAKFICQINIDNIIVVSDTSWTGGYGNIVMNAIRLGEYYDGRNNEDNCAKLQKVNIVAGAGGKLTPSQLPPILECEKLSAINVFSSNNGTIYDFGKNITGYCGITVFGESGQTVTLRYSDRLTNNQLDNSTNSMYIFNSGNMYQVDKITLSNKKIFVKPKFVYHGFRYVEIVKSNDNICIENVQAYFVHTDLDKIGDFSCSDSALNSLYSMSINSILSNYHGFPTDCPHREKNGWTGDAQLSLETCLYNFNMHEAYKKWLNDFIDCQRLTGQISAIVPTCGWGYNWGAGPAWDIALFRITQKLLDFYGDENIANKMYPIMKKYFDYISTFVENDFLSMGLGDWNYPKSITFKVCPLELTDTCYYALMAEIMADISIKLHKNGANNYKKIAIRTKNAVKNRYSNVEESLTGMAALTYFDVSNETDRILEYLNKNNFELHAGILGVKFLLTALGKFGYIEEGYKILTKTDYPSFGYWIKNGQTSLCENFEMSYSLNHHMYSSVSEFMIKYICGIDFKNNMQEIIFTPKLPKLLEFAKCKINTPYGIVEIKIENAKKTIYSIQMPANTFGKIKFNDEEVGLKSGNYIF